MDPNTLRAALEPWMRTSTWHTDHPHDEERYHRALATAFKTADNPVECEQLETVMLDLARTYHPKMAPQALMERVDELAQRAEDLSVFVYHTRDL